MDCKLCDYYSCLGYSETGKEISKCDFTNTLFGEDVENLDYEYPCKNVAVSERSYLYNKHSLSPRNCSIYEFDNWRYFYKKEHTTDGILRYIKRSISA